MSGQFYKGYNYEEFWGGEKAKKIKENIGAFRRNKTYEELYGREKAKQLRENLRKKTLFNTNKNPMKNP